MKACTGKMSNFFIEDSITIRTPASRVWRVFTDPVLTRQMGGEYISDWKTSSPLQWKSLDGNVITNGSILAIVSEKVLQHTLRNSVHATNSVITYEFREADGVTVLSAREEFAQPITDSQSASAAEGWKAALQAIKETAERTE
jgi:uncharacterized protein YndB with AHSA1/START domain